MTTATTTDLSDPSTWGPLPHQTRNGKHRYSLLRALTAHVGSGGKRAPDGLEGECSAEIARRSGRHPAGFYVPGDVFLGSRRALDTSSGAGAYPTIMPEDGLIQALRAKLAVAGLGGRITNVKPNLAGKLALPRVVTGTAVTWSGEGAAGSAVNATFDQVVMTPKTVSAFTPLTRRMAQSAFDPAFETIVANDITKSIAVEVDRVAFAGSGTSNQPTGLLLTSGVDVQAAGINGAAPSRPLLLQMEEAATLANADGAPDSRLGWVTTPSCRRKLRSIDASTGAAGAWIWADNNLVLGNPAIATTNMPSTGAKGSGTNLHSLIFGEWSSLLVNLFSELDLLYDPYSSSTSGNIVIRVSLDCDVALLHPASFSVCKDLVVT